MAKIVVLATGGTIAGRASHAGEAVTYTAAQLGVADLLANVPGLAALLGHYKLETVQVAQIDSKDMDIATWQRLLTHCVQALQQPEVAGLVLTHGTDTLEETAFFLHQALGVAAQAGVLAPVQACKPVVLTCAMRPATARLADGPQNLADAIAVVKDTHARGVMAVCAGQVHAAVDVRKVHPYRLDAFSSGDAGVLAHVEESCVRWLRPTMQPDADLVACSGNLQQYAARVWHALCTVAASDWPWVEVLQSHAGASARALQALVAAGVRGLILEGTGNATLHEALLEAAMQARRQDVVVWRSSRCQEGAMVPGTDNQVPLALSAGQTLPPAKARIALQIKLLRKW